MLIVPSLSKCVLFMHITRGRICRIMSFSEFIFWYGFEILKYFDFFYPFLFSYFYFCTICAGLIYPAGAVVVVVVVITIIMIIIITIFI